MKEVVSSQTEQIGRAPSRADTEQAIKTRLRRSIRVQRALAGVGLVVGVVVGAPLSFNQRSADVADAMIVEILGVGIIAGVERYAAARQCQKHVVRYAGGQAVGDGILDAKTRRFATIVNGDLMPERRYYDNAADYRDVGGLRGIVSGSVPLLSYVGAGTVVTELTARVQDPGLLLGVVLLNAAAVLHGMNEDANRSLEGVYTRELDNVDGGLFIQTE